MAFLSKPVRCPRRWLQGWPAASHAVWPVADQACISATNFLITILLARALSMADFGTFTLVVSVLLLANCVQSCLVTQPHNVLGSALSDAAYSRYTTATAASQVLLMVAGMLLAAIGAAVAQLAKPPIAPLFLMLAVTLPVWQLQEFFRRVLYTEQRFGAALVNDVVTCAIQVGVVLYLASEDRLTPSLGLAALAAGYLVGAVCGGWQTHTRFMWTSDFAAVRENFRYGQWLLGGELLGQWLATQLFVIMAAAALGTAAAGVLRAMHTILGPSRLLAQTFATTLPTQLARSLATGEPKAMADRLRRAHLLTFALLGSYCLLVALFGTFLMQITFGHKYAGNQGVLALYALAAFVGYLTILAAAGLRAKRRTRAIFMAELISAPVVLLGAVLATELGIYGVVLAMLLADLVLLILLWRAFGMDDESTCFVSENEPAMAGSTVES